MLVFNKDIEAIQLDAMKEGMRRAESIGNEILDMAQCEVSCPCRYSVAKYQEAILTAAEQLTIPN